MNTFQITGKVVSYREIRTGIDPVLSITAKIHGSRNPVRIMARSKEAAVVRRLIDNDQLFECHGYILSDQTGQPILVIGRYVPEEEMIS